MEYKTISELTKYIKNHLEGDEYLQRVLIKGEVSNFKRQSSGHLYFTLKDETTRLNAVMFAGNASRLNFNPEDGMTVLVEGAITVYEPNGNYQIRITNMNPDGMGNLHLEFEKLKSKLAAEGLFAEADKKEIPRFPVTIGIVTAATGAAVHDIISTIRSRYPIAKTILFPTLVQGEGAKEDIVRALTKAQEYEVDVIICGRGGGSMEDLWAFNEEIVARAIHACKIPIISAVGHEPDVTIADFVADFRAATPTKAAVKATPDLGELVTNIASLKIRLQENVKNKLRTLSDHFKRLESARVLKNPMAMYEVKAQKLDGLNDIINKIMRERLTKVEHSYELMINKLQLLNPLTILEKGYSVVKKDDMIIKDSANIQLNDEIMLKLFKGKIRAIVKEKI